jgi:hypothetical protein
MKRQELLVVFGILILVLGLALFRSEQDDPTFGHVKQSEVVFKSDKIDVLDTNNHLPLFEGISEVRLVVEEHSLVVFWKCEDKNLGFRADWAKARWQDKVDKSKGILIEGRHNPARIGECILKGLETEDFEKVIRFINEAR